MRELEQDLRKGVGYFLRKVFKDQELVEATLEAIATRYEPTAMLEDVLGDYISRLTIPADRIYTSKLFSFSTADIINASVYYGQAGINYGEGHIYGKLRILDAPAYYIGEYTPAFLCDKLTNPSVVYALGVDYDVLGGRIVFKEDPLKKETTTVSTHTDSQVTSTRFELWGLGVAEGTEDLNRYYGAVYGTTASKGEELKRGINLTANMHIDGLTEDLLHQTLCVIADVDYVLKEGAVLEIYTEGDRSVVRTNTGVYTAPSWSTPIVKAGDHVLRGQILFDAYRVSTFPDPLPNQVTELEITPGMAPFLKDNLGIPNYSVEISENGGSYSFPVAGSTEDAEAFMTILNTASTVITPQIDNCGNTVNAEEQLTFFDLVARYYGMLPGSFIPAHFIVKMQWGPEVTLIYMHPNVPDTAFRCQLINAMNRTLPAGSMLLFV